MEIRIVSAVVTVALGLADGATIEGRGDGSGLQAPRIRMAASSPRIDVRRISEGPPMGKPPR